MPIYKYKCSNCDTTFEAIRSVDERKTAPCIKCPCNGLKQVTTANFDPAMGLDPDFPTAYEKWGNQRRDLSCGKQKDSNNSKLTHVDVDKTTWESKNGRKAD